MEENHAVDSGTLKIVLHHTPIREIEPKAKKIVERLLQQAKSSSNLLDLEFHISTSLLLDDNELDDRFECSVEVKASGLTSHFADFVAMLLHHSVGVTETRVSFIVSSSNFFSFVFIPAHINMETREIHFGNILEKFNFLSHKYVTTETSLVPMINSFLGLTEDENNSTTLFTTMEHDRRILNIKFPYSRNNKPVNQHHGHVNNLKNRFHNNNHRHHQNSDSLPPNNFEAVVALQASYNNFRHIIVDFESKREGLYSMKIFFYLYWPMTVKLFRFFKDYCQQNQKKTSDKNPSETAEEQDTVEVDVEPEPEQPALDVIELDEYCKSRGGFWSKRGLRYPAWDNAKNYSAQAEAVNGSPVFMIKLKSLTAKECTQLLGRIYTATGKPIEFRHLNHMKKDHRKQQVESPFNDPFWMRNLAEDASFGFRYLLAALLSRGNCVKDLILICKKNKDEFMEEIMDSYRRDKALTLETMERLLNEVDERLENSDLLQAFIRIKKRLMANTSLLQQVYEDSKKEGYVRIRKIVITPTRTLYIAPELLMSNRVLRKHDPDGEKTLRVLFRDDDGNKIYANNVTKQLIDRTVGEALRRGILVAGKEFRFLGSSNSQMRDNGCYFFEGSLEEIAKIRRDLGQFKIQSIPKIMSRIGQCFTQAREITVELHRHQYNTTYDYIGEDKNGKLITFSDGVGILSLDFAKQISRSLEMGVGCIPSCFQIRFRGYKGVMSVDLGLDAKKKWGERNKLVDSTKDHKRWLYLDAMFRPSQHKFLAPRATLIEVVKHSAPVLVSLNKPMINILDQVSSMQSYESHMRITSRIHWLLDRHLHEWTRCLIDEQRCRNKLNEFPKLILYDQLVDFNLTQEPFFRSLIQASSRYSLKRTLSKLQVPIPTSLGRSMFGIVDETGELQYGQVFVRYTKNAGLKFPGKNAERETLKGPVLVTKNPCIVPGDVRMFEAVDVPSLRHLSDVIVFPRHGPRPHPDEMAGSDLDGDEYTVIWDEQLYFERNEPAFDFTSETVEPEEVTDENLPDLMCDFYVKYMEQDSIGKIANAFINNADQYGIESEVCKRIALKHNKAVDFPKTGIPPAPLYANWDPEGDVPPEKCERWADFMEKLHEPSYASPRLIGQLFRRVKVIDDVLKVMIIDNEQSAIPLDPYIEIDGWKKFEEEVLVEYESYTSHLQNLMDCYQIHDEGELFSSCFISLKNRVSDRDNDDMSLYNTTTIIEQRLSTIYAKFRKAFFERFGDFDELTRIDMHRTSKEHKEVFRRVCIDLSEPMKQRACAYYKVAYQQRPRGGRPFLSFAWLVWDVINELRREQLYSQNRRIMSFSFDPLSDRLSKHIDEFVSANQGSFNRFKKKTIEPNASLKRYCKRHQGLSELLYFCYKWGNQHDLFIGPFQPEHLCCTILLFGMNKLPSQNFESMDSNWLEEVDSSIGVKCQIDLSKQRGGIGRKFLMLIEFFSTRQFEKMEKLDFLSAGLDCYSFFFEQEWNDLHILALKTFNSISYTNRFDLLPCVEGVHDEHLTKNDKTAIEADPFVIEVPSIHMKSITPEMTRKLEEKTGCNCIVIRALSLRPKSETARMIVSSFGTLESNQRLRDLLTIRPNLNVPIGLRQKAMMIAAQVYERLTVD